MTPATFASRLIAQRRRAILRAGIPLGVASFLVVYVSAILMAVTASNAEFERTNGEGELVLTSRAESGEEAQTFFSESVLPGATEHDTRESRAIVWPAMFGIDGGWYAGTVWFTDIGSETAFRAIPGDLSGPVLLGGPEPARDDLQEVSDKDDPGGTAGANITVSLPGRSEVVTNVVRAGGSLSRPPILLLSWASLPDEWTPSAPGPVKTIRLRGRTVLSEREVLELSLSTGLPASGWRDVARDGVQSLWATLFAAGAILYFAGGAACGGAIRVLWNRHLADFRLLTSLGHRRRYLVRLLAWVGSLAAGIPAAVGAIAAAITISVTNLRGGVDLTLITSIAPKVDLPVRVLEVPPPLIIGFAAVAVAMCIGALSALPTAMLTDRIGKHGTQWH